MPAPVAEERVLLAPVLQPGGGVFDGGITVNISASNDDAASVDGNSSAVTVVHYMVSEPAEAPSYKSYPTVRSDILELGNGSAPALAAANTSATAEEIDEGGEEYGEPLILGPGRVVISAYASRDGWEQSPVVSETYDVLECGEDKCCQWSVVYMRVKALLDKLAAKNASLAAGTREVQERFESLHAEWLTSNSRYQAALIKVKDEQEDTEYAVGKDEMWKEAVRGAQQQVSSIKQVVAKHLADLREERALIQWIIGQLESAQLSPNAALGRVEQSLTDIQGSDTMGDLQKILVSAQAAVGRGRIHGAEAAKKAALASAGKAHTQELAAEEPQEIVAILQEMIADLATREHMFTSMLAKAQAQLRENTDKYDKWEGALNKAASAIDASRRIIADEEERRQVLAGKLLVAQQAVDASESSYPMQADMLAASIASYQRVIVSLLGKARGACAAVVQEESDVIAESKQVQSLMSKIRTTPKSLMTPRLRAQMAALQQLVNQESTADAASSSPAAPILDAQAKSAQLAQEAQGTDASKASTFDWPESARGAMLGERRKGDPAGLAPELADGGQVGAGL